MRQFVFCSEVPLRIAVTVEDVNAISGELLSSCTVGCAFSLLHLIIKLLAGAGSFLAVPTDLVQDAYSLVECLLDHRFWQPLV